MSNDADKFFRATGADKFETVNHNERDFASYREFQQGIDQRYEKVERERLKQERAVNLKKWQNSLAPPWSEAKLSTLKDQKAAKEAEAIIKAKKLSSFYIKGKSFSGKTFLALAIVRRYIGLGWLLPSQVHHISEADVLSIARSGFRYNDNMASLLHKSHKAYIIDNVGAKKAYSDDEQGIWGTFFDHVSRHGLVVLFTSQKEVSEFQNKLTDSCQAKFAFLVNERVVTLNGKVAPPTVDDDENSLLDIGPQEDDSVLHDWS